MDELIVVLQEYSASGHREKAVVHGHVMDGYFEFTERQVKLEVVFGYIRGKTEDCACVVIE